MNDKEGDQIQLLLAAVSLVIGFTTVGSLFHPSVMTGFSIGLAAALGMSGLLYRFWYLPRAMSYLYGPLQKGKTNRAA
ncbi:MAG: hypothetical protein AABX47_10220 [Nanoarchaeota archaeon]